MKGYSITISIILYIITILISGCVSNRVNLVKDNRVFLERLPSREIHVSKAYIYQEGDKIIITGRVKTHHISRILSKGHIDIAILDPDEIILTKISISYPPRIIKRRGSPESSFSVHLPLIPPSGSMVRIGYHDSSYSDDKIFDCGENVALSWIERRQ